MTKNWFVLVVLCITLIAGCIAGESMPTPPEPEVWLDDCLSDCAGNYEVGSTWHGQCTWLCNAYYDEVLH